METKKIIASIIMTEELLSDRKKQLEEAITNLQNLRKALEKPLEISKISENKLKIGTNMHFFKRFRLNIDPL